MNFDSYHQILGFFIVFFILGQFSLGFLHHRQHRRTQLPTKFGKIHLWFGRLIILLGIMNGFLYVLQPLAHPCQRHTDSIQWIHFRPQPQIRHHTRRSSNSHVFRHLRHHSWSTLARHPPSKLAHPQRPRLPLRPPARPLTGRTRPVARPWPARSALCRPP